MPASILKIDAKNPEEEIVAGALKVIKRGGLVALPTETVYGLAVDVENEAAIKKVFSVKRRPLTEGLIIGIEKVSDLATFARTIPDLAINLLKVFSPGPLTVVLPKKETVSPLLTGGTDKVALRIPRSGPTLAIIKEKFITLTSANRHGRPSPRTALDVYEELGEEIDLILDGGPTEIGKESTIVDFTQTPPKVLREGAIPTQAILKFWGG